MTGLPKKIALLLVTSFAAAGGAGAVPPLDCDPTVAGCGPAVFPKPPVNQPLKDRRPGGRDLEVNTICRQGYVWREARVGDLVCVPPATRTETKAENSVAGSRVDPRGGPYGRNTCRSGFVWREAFDGDLTCVPPASRDRAKADNAAAARRVAR